MTLKDLYRLAIEQGGDAVSRALGRADAELAHNPGNRQALMTKGSLLTMVGEEVLTAARRRDYIRSGVSMMDSALAFPGHYPAVAWELDYLRASTLAMLPPDMGWDQTAYDVLRVLCGSDDFDAQEDFERARCLCLLACQAEALGHAKEARDRFRQARVIDEALVIKTYSDWAQRAATAPETP